MPYIDSQLESILNQSRRPDEIVISDDGSTDGTLDTIKQYSKEFPELFRVHENEEQLGPTMNIEQCIRCCSGDVIALCDQDDIWIKSKIEKQLNVIQNEGVKFTFHNATLVTESGDPITDLWNTIPGAPVLEGDKNTFKALLRRNFVQGATILFDASLREDLLPFHGLFEYDRYMPIIATLLGVQQGIDEELNQWRQHESQAIGAPDTSILENVKSGIWNSNNYIENDIEMWPILRSDLLGFNKNRLNVDKGYAIKLLKSREAFSVNRQAIYDDETPRLESMKHFYDNVENGRYSKFGTGKAGILTLLRDFPEAIK